MRETTVAAVATAADRGLDQAAYALSQVMSLAFVYRQAYDGMLAVQDRALACARRAGHVLAEATCARDLGATYATLGEHARAQAQFQHALALYTRAGCARGEAEALASLGANYRQQGRLTDAVDHLTQSLTIARELGDRRNEARRLNNLAATYLDLRQFEDAATASRQALHICGGTDRVLTAYILDTLGRAHAGQHRHPDAIAAYHQGIALATELGERWIKAVMLANLARTHHAAGQLQDARRNAETALRVVDEFGLPDGDDLRRANIVELIRVCSPRGGGGR